MTGYFLRRLLAMVPTFLGITLVTFVIVNLAPGGPIEQMLREIRFGAVSGGGPAPAVSAGGSAGTAQGVNEEILAELRRQFGYDKPLLVRYGLWLGNLARLDFGDSFVHGEPVIRVIAGKFPVSLQFGVAAFVLTYLVCIPLGIAKAVRDGTWFDFGTSVLVFVGYAVSPLMLGILLIVLFGGGSFLDWFPISGAVADFHDLMGPWEQVLDRLHHFVLPLLCYLIGNFATLTLLMKNAILEEIGKAYVTAARAKGLAERAVFYRHVLRNALIPIATGLGGFLGVFFVGNLFIEQIFSLDGMGLLFYNALLARDYPVLLGLLSLVSLVLMAGNFVSDFLYVLVDPRIDFAK
ncbi:MAG: ABC transporter permease subunit [Candidatus Lambdaproteobacteria bacterium]|nr:ABC transporter permease subunit [Candidatus Lambdaproteobacteria bacterium]